MKYETKRPATPFERMLGAHTAIVYGEPVLLDYRPAHEAANGNISPNEVVESSIALIMRDGSRKWVVLKDGVHLIDERDLLHHNERVENDGDQDDTIRIFPAKADERTGVYDLDGSRFSEAEVRMLRAETLRDIRPYPIRERRDYPGVPRWSKDQAYLAMAMKGYPGVERWLKYRASLAR